MTEPEVIPPLVPAPLARGARGAVVAPHHLATAAGLGVLADGGSAVDAAVATNAVLAVVMPNGCGIGGDAFWLVWDEVAGVQTALNGSGRSPAAADAGALRSRGLDRIPARGPLSITVPGAVRSWGDAHRRWGRLSLDRVLGPAIEQAEGGFPAWPGFIAAVETTASRVPIGEWGRGFHAVYRAAGRPWRAGERVRLPALGRTLRRLAREGTDAFYDSDLADRVTDALTSVGAPFFVGDLRDHASIWETPIATTYRGVRVTTHPPNSCGVVALEILNVLEHLGRPDGRFGAGGWTDPRWIHLGIEASKRALVDRDRELADPRSRDVPVERLLAKDYAATVAATIDDARPDTSPVPVRTLVGGTIYLAVVDRDGNAVSLIQSNAAGFGSGVVDPVTGVHFQNRGASFSLEPGHPNELGPRKQTVHSLLPGMLFRRRERRPWVVVGSMGGDIQPQIHAQAVSALVDGHADVATAVSAARWSVVPDGFVAPPVDVAVEARVEPSVVDALRGMGHRVRVGGMFDSSFGHCHAIELVDGGPAARGTLAAATDPRSEGLPAAR
ncbi:MAG: gamma-glutamyltransferase family protein [Chloroflexota bacterium]